MKTISDIYAEYKIFNGLRIHMLRAAAVAKLICDRTSADVPRDAIVTAMLLHDMGNIIKAKLEFFAESAPNFFEPEGLEYWEKVQQEFFQKYGTDEHAATVMIAKEIGIDTEMIRLFDESVGFRKIPHVAANGNLPDKIALYSDMRVGPFGIISLNERLDEGAHRQGQSNNKNSVTQDFEAYRRLMSEIEKEIFATTDISPEDINDATAAPIIEELRAWQVK